MNTKLSRGRPTSSSPRATRVKKAFSKSGTIRASRCDLNVRILCAVRLGRNPRELIDAPTLSAKSARTALPLTTLDTVAGETPACRATS